MLTVECDIAACHGVGSAWHVWHAYQGWREHLTLWTETTSSVVLHQEHLWNLGIKNITVSNTPVNDVDNDKLKNHSVAMGTPVIKINKKHSERICWQEPKQQYIATIVCSTSLATGNPRKQGTKEYWPKTHMYTNKCFTCCGNPAYDTRQHERVIDCLPTWLSRQEQRETGKCLQQMRVEQYSSTINPSRKPMLLL